MKHLFTLFTALLFAGSMTATPVEIYKNEGTTTTINGITASGNVNTKGNGNPGDSFANTTSSNTTFTFAGFDVANYSDLQLSLDAKFASFPSTTETWPYLEIVFYKNDQVVQRDTTVKWTAKGSTYSTYEIEIDEDFDKIVCIGHPATGKTGKGADATNYAIYFDNFTVSGEPTGVSILPPVILPSATEFYGEIEVSITCATEGAAIYYTLDGNDPTAASAEYTTAFKLSESKTVKAIAIKDEVKSSIASITYTIHPSFESIEALVAANLESNTLVEVSFESLTIDSIYSNSSSVKKGIYIDVLDATGLKAVEIYYGTGSLPDDWAIGGTVSGKIRGNWTYYNNGKQWEIVPNSGFKWADLSYTAPSPTSLDNTASDTKAVKTIVNGQLIIEKAGVKYNVLGQTIR